MLYTIQNEFLKATVSLYGAELQSLIAADGTEFLWQGDPAYWNERSPILFPYIGRMTNKSFYLDGELHHMQNHGIRKFLHGLFQPAVEYRAAHTHIVGQPLGSCFSFQRECLRSPDLLRLFVLQQQTPAADIGFAVERDIEGFVDTVHTETFFPGLMVAA